jgi:hypothetical protein
MKDKTVILLNEFEIAILRAAPACYAEARKNLKQYIEGLENTSVKAPVHGSGDWHQFLKGEAEAQAQARATLAPLTRYMLLNPGDRLQPGDEYFQYGVWPPSWTTMDNALAGKAVTDVMGSFPTVYRRRVWV